ncbi:MAG: sensor histidine kinase, partial [Marinicellaceae bacterium]
IQCNIEQLIQEIIQESETRLTAASITLRINRDLINPKQSLAASVPAVITRICREVISNVIKHAEASEVKMTFTGDNKQLNIAIEDNGKGFSKHKSTGKGFKTINKRAQSISSVIKWQSQLQQGTIFTLNYQYGNH